MELPSTVVSQRTRILVMLQEAGERGVTNFELSKLVALRYSARIEELRKKYHYDIETIRLSAQEYRFVLHDSAKVPQSAERSVGVNTAGAAPPTERASLDYSHQCELEFRGGCFDDNR